jgi:uroporphyrinogen decarboxylase
LIVFGPISVTTLLPFGTPQDVRAEVQRVLEVCRDKVSLIYFTSSSINPDVPLDNILAFWDEVLNSHW